MSSRARAPHARVTAARAPRALPAQPPAPPLHTVHAHEPCTLPRPPAARRTPGSRSGEIVPRPRAPLHARGASDAAAALALACVPTPQPVARAHLAAREERLHRGVAVVPGVVGRRGAMLRGTTRSGDGWRTGVAEGAGGVAVAMRTRGGGARAPSQAPQRPPIPRRAPPSLPPPPPLPPRPRCALDRSAAPSAHPHASDGRRDQARRARDGRTVPRHRRRRQHSTPPHCPPAVFTPALAVPYAHPPSVQGHCVRPRAAFGRARTSGHMPGTTDRLPVHGH